MRLAREAGILLHPTSLPGIYGIGELGSQADTFIDFLAESGIRLWQILPLGPTGYGNSPYQTLSAFAGNPFLISIEYLIRDRLLPEQVLQQLPDFPAKRVDYGRLIPFKTRLLQQAFHNFQQGSFPELKAEFEEFCHHYQYWLDDYALYRAIKDQQGGGAWTDWPAELVRREPHALQARRSELAQQIEAIRFEQFLFYRQWRAIRRRAAERNIKIIGDIPIFLAHDSADVWAHQDYFYLDENGQPLVVAGVPPDYFSETGQRWGNPLYRWDVMAAQHYSWWIQRFRAIFDLVDIVRIDHFRGFEAYWEVPAEEETAIHGRWVKGPGAHFFEVLQQEIGNLPIIAEDLGVITEEVIALRDQFEFPGMRVLQFAFADGEDARFFLPHNYPRNCVVYTGTHDNDTCVGWFQGNDLNSSTRTQEEIEAERARAKKYMNTDGREIHWDFIRLAFGSVANTAIVPLQDVLGLGSEARMNLPGRPDGNWEWRFRTEALTREIRHRLRELVELFERDGKMMQD
ncbi:MAG: 4-alpha-glucanotransferase [candidate division KSB1 bacterium]|nr:4-alpha-glucanotransferase [candidate division KSB1 bacterium]MDQ7066108.1 4-alpha-glucanotransferase [candidate division KSB1 bacterium]